MGERDRGDQLPCPESCHERAPCASGVFLLKDDMDERNLFFYKAKVLRWIDGDTVELLVDLGFHTYRRERFRLCGVNAPELRPARDKFKTEADRLAHIAKAKETLAYCEKLCRPDTFVMIKTYMDKQEKYGRYLCDIEIAGLTTLNKMLIEGGYAEPA